MSYFLGRIIRNKLQNYYTNRYGKKYLKSYPKKDEIFLLVHFFIGLIAILLTEVNQMITYTIFIIEFITVLILSRKPFPYFTIKACLIPASYVILYIIIVTVVNEINHKNSMMITNCVFLGIHLIYSILLHKYNQKINLKLKVIKKKPITYDKSIIFFQDDNEREYLLYTDLDEKFECNDVFNIKMQNKNLHFAEKDNQKWIKGIDASLFIKVYNEKENTSNSPNNK